MKSAEERLVNPFPGLRPFDDNDADVRVFFGRDDQIDELLARLQIHRFLAVVGTSGSGKSSLVRAGLLPALHGGFMAGAGSHWRIAVMRPGSSPTLNLARALEKSGTLGKVAADPSLRLGLTRGILERGSRGLVEAVAQAHIAPDENVLILVDQFEELFRFKQAAEARDGSDEAAAFVKLLLTAAAQPDSAIYVLLTMRSDFLGESAQFRDLPETINDGLFLVPRLTREQLREVIEGPVGVAGAEITPRLVNRLMNDLGDDPDQLPVLQHALMRTWSIWNSQGAPDAPLDVAQYDATGGLAKALSLHGDEILHSLATDRLRTIAEKVFKALTDRGSDNRGLRRPASFADLCAITAGSPEDVRAVVDAFRAAGRSFVMPPEDTPLEAGTVVDLSHESLMRIWIRLEKWVDEEAESAQTYRRLAEATMLYAAGRGGLWGDPTLALATAWRAQNHPNAAWAEAAMRSTREKPAYASTVHFLEESAAALAAAELLEEQSERREREEAERRAGLERAAEIERTRAAAAQRLQRRTRLFAAVVSVMLLLAVVLAFAAQRQTKIAVIQEAKANQQAALALRLQQTIERNARRQKVSMDAKNATLAALAAKFRALASLQTTIANNNARLAVTNGTLAQKNGALAQRNALLAAQQVANARRSLAESNSEKLARLDSSLYRTGLDYRLDGLIGVAAYTTSPTAEAADMLLTGVETPGSPAIGHVALPAWSSGTVAQHGTLLTLLTGKVLTTLDAATLAVRSRIPAASAIAYCGFRSSSRVAVAVAGHVSVYDVSSARGRLVTSRRTGPVLAMACAPNHETVFIAGSDGVLRSLDLAAGRTFAIGEMPGRRVNTVIASPRATYVATIANDGSAAIFDVAQKRRIQAWKFADVASSCTAACAGALAFSPAERRIAWYDANAVHMAPVGNVSLQKAFPCARVLCGAPTLAYAREDLPPTVIAAGVPAQKQGNVFFFNGENKLYEVMWNYAVDAQSPGTLYDRDLQMYATSDAPGSIPNPYGHSLATHSLAAISGTDGTVAFQAGSSEQSAPMLGAQPASQWNDSYALTGHVLILPGTRALHAYNLDRYRVSILNAAPVSDRIRLRDSGDGVHAVSMNYGTGTVQVLTLRDRRHPLASFRLSPIRTDASGYYLDNPQIAYDPAAHLVTIDSSAGIRRYDLRGHLVMSRSWEQIGTAANLRLPAGYLRELSNRGNYIIIREPEKVPDWLVTVDGRRVGSSYAMRSLSRDERFAFARENLDTRTLSMYALPKWHSVGLVVVPSSAQYVSLSPDGKTIGFVNDKGTKDVPDYQLGIYDVQSKNLLLVSLPKTPNLERYYGVSISADNRYEIVTYKVKGDTGRTLAAYSLDPREWMRGICLMAGRPLTRGEFRSVVGSLPYRDGCAPYVSQMYGGKHR